MLKRFYAPVVLNERLLTGLAGVILGLLGLAMLARFGVGPAPEFHWWAVFILLPALLFFGGAGLAARRPALGRLALALLGLGLVVLMVAAIFLLNLDWAQAWPLMLIVVGLTLIAVGLPNLAPLPGPSGAAWISLLAWSGLSVFLLGVTFLAGNMGWVDLAALAKSWGWWSVFVLLSGLGAGFNAAWLWRKSGGITLAVLGILLLADTLLIAGIYEWIQFPRRIEQLAWILITGAAWLGVYLVFRRRSQ